MKYPIYLLSVVLTLMMPGSVFADSGGVSERVIRRTVVPSAEDPHGEVQVLRRGDQVVVRTLLDSPILKRVVAAIDGKEEKRWPPDSDGFVESQRYRDALFAATDLVWKKFRERENREEKNQTLGIDFIKAPDKMTVVLFHPRLAGDFGSLRVLDSEMLASWRSRGPYVPENMIAIVHDSFGLDADEARQLLEQSAHE